jgi:hypothetical protein
MNDMSLPLGVTTPQFAALIPETFQQNLIDNITASLHRQNPPPCLLRAPTGSGKTFILSRVMANVSAKDDVLWFWFVPYVNLVNQTLDALITNAGDLSPALLSNGINQEPEAGQVLISTTQGVSKKAWRTAGYDIGGGELTRTAAEFVQLVRSRGMTIGVVVDEAHIALDEATEFGKFVSWLGPQYLLMATATPKSERINQFLASADYSSFESFSISRDDVVKARLNKAFIEAVVYDLRQSTASVTDLKRTVLRQAWRRNQKLKKDLATAGIAINPLMLVQVDNGAGMIEAVEQDLIQLCRIPPHAIGKHSADAPDPMLMSSIAVDESIEVLIFKQSAGTGFDAPRAFVLASTKAVSDADFAMQFIGRVMRVTREIRAQYTRAEDIPVVFNTAYVYLANAHAQKGYQAAIQVTEGIKTSLEGEVEKMHVRPTRGGAMLITNKPVRQPDLASNLALPSELHSDEYPSSSEAGDATSHADALGTAEVLAAGDDKACQPGLWDAGDDEALALDQPELVSPADLPPSPCDAVTYEEWKDALGARGLKLYPINRSVQALPLALKREERPGSLNMASITKAVATRVEIPERHRNEAIAAALGRLRESERHTELVKGVVTNQQAVVVVDRDVIARQARAAMNSLPQIEESDHRILLETLAARIEPACFGVIEGFSDEDVDSDTVKRATRTASQWLVRVLVQELEEMLHAEIAKQAIMIDAAPLPDVLVFPADIGLMHSMHNLYGVLPPSREELEQVERLVLREDRGFLEERTWHIGSGDASVTIRTGRFDHSHSLNNDEMAFAHALDRADFVDWWFRNPDKKPYSVRLVRGEHRNFFYPDFVVCLSHIDGDTPMQRLVETKHDVKDAQRKAQHIPDIYGPVLFLTRDAGRFRVVTDDGLLGQEVDMDDPETFRACMQKTMPSFS